MNKQQEEQLLIQQFHNCIQNQKLNEIFPLISKINNDFKHSYVLQFYLGYFYELVNKLDLAEESYMNSINIKQLFTQPYFQLCDILLKQNKFNEAEQLLLTIYNKKTLNPMSPTGEKVYDLMSDLRIATTLSAHYMENKEYKKVEDMYKILLPRIKQTKTITFKHLEVWKIMQLALANIYSVKYQDMEIAHEHYYLGLEGLCDYNKTQSYDNQDILHKLDISLFQGYSISSNYIFNKKNLTFTINDLYNRYRIKNENTIRPKNNKIRIGYMSPDFNKNAVGLFVTSLLKNYNQEKFEIYIYYTCKFTDEFTQVFKSYNNKWFDISKMNDEESYDLIKNHNIDILFDLIVLGSDARLSLIAKKPAPIIINYLGYPDFSDLKEFNYRLVDNTTDPHNKNRPFENLLKKNNCFICYTLFENISLNSAPIEYNRDESDKNVYIGVMNKLSKHHLLIRKIWTDILQKKKNYVLCIKLGKNEILPEDMYKDIPKNQLKILPFTETLPEYFEQFNHLDLSIDTYPYSGTTTTCSSLLMGVPVITINRGEHGQHVSNVSASVIKHTNTYLDDNEFEKYICNSLKEYKEQILKYSIDRSNEQNKRINRRNAFLKAMNPKKFIKEFESTLESIHLHC